MPNLSISHPAQAPLEHSPTNGFLSSPILLRALQIVLALAFLAAGLGKLFASDQTLEDNSVFPVLFLRAIAVCELLGAAGLILPGLVRVHRELTAVAAAGLAVIMTGATATELLSGDPATAWLPFVLGSLAALVAWRRWPAPGQRVRDAGPPSRITTSSPR